MPFQETRYLFYTGKEFCFPIVYKRQRRLRILQPSIKLTSISLINLPSTGILFYKNYFISIAKAFLVSSIKLVFQYDDTLTLSAVPKIIVSLIAFLFFVIPCIVD